jgi:hypothetical protein
MPRTAADSSSRTKRSAASADCEGSSWSTPATTVFGEDEIERGEDEEGVVVLAVPRGAISAAKKKKK